MAKQRTLPLPKPSLAHLMIRRGGPVLTLGDALMPGSKISTSTKLITILRLLGIKIKTAVWM